MRVFTFYPDTNHYAIPMFSMFVPDEQEPDEKQYDEEFNRYSRDSRSTLVRQPAYYTVQELHPFLRLFGQVVPCEKHRVCNIIDGVHTPGKLPKGWVV